nr:retrovirus-related Pol polyprotein from transposon TNT 1-94 [Tanacetum cinerariifolium]
IQHQTSVARTPEQNGVVERRNRTLVEDARTMLIAAKVPLFFWAKAIATACFTQNRSLVIPRHEKTPYHIINDRKPSVKFFHIFGSVCYIVRDGENLDKMKEKDRTVTTSNKLDLLFSPMFNELLNGSSKVVSKSSAVSATDAPNQHQQYTTPLNNHTTPAPTRQSPTLEPTAISSENINQAETYAENDQVADDEFINIFSTPVQDQRETSSRHVDSLNMHTFYQRYPSEHHWTKDHPLEQVIRNPSQSVRTRRQLESDAEICFINIFSTPVQDQGETSSRHVDSSNMHTFYERYPSEQRWTKDHPLEQVIGNPSQSVRTRRQLESDAEMCMFALTVSRTEPKNIKEAMADSAWIESMQEELHQFNRLDVWELVDRPLISFLENLPEHLSNTKVFTMKMEILLEPTPNKLLCMQTRSSSRLVSNPSSNPTPSTNSNPKGRNHRRSKQRIEEFKLKELSRASPHHGFSQLHQLNTFYNALNSKDQDSLNSAAGVVAKVSTNTSTSGISPDVAELKDMVKALLLDKKSQNPAPATVKVVKESCVTCGGAHSYRNCPATDGNVYRENIQKFVSQASAVNYNQGNTSYRLPMMSNQIRPPSFPPVPNNQNVQLNQRNNQNRFNQNQNRGNNFNHGPVYQPIVFQPPAYQAPAYQAPAPQTQSVSKEDFSVYVKANDAVMRNMKTQGQNMQNQLTNLTDLLTMFMNSNSACKTQNLKI